MEVKIYIDLIVVTGFLYLPTALSQEKQLGH
jgi:hypothetical protein